MKTALYGLTAAVLFVLAGCAPALPSNRALLDFLDDGTTTKETVFLNLGRPSGTFNAERIVTYRLGGNKEAGYVLLDRGSGTSWTGVKFNLVLVFDERNILAKHSLVQIQ